MRFERPGHVSKALPPKADIPLDLAKLTATRELQAAPSETRATCCTLGLECWILGFSYRELEHAYASSEDAWFACCTVWGINKQV